MKMRKMEALKCQNCGASGLKPIWHGGTEFLKCEYCGTEYEAHEEIEEPEALPSESVSGMKQTGEYVVYKHLDVRGMNNRVILIDAASEKAIHVKNLDVCGMNNVVRVKLMPGATKDVPGISNKVE